MASDSTVNTASVSCGGLLPVVFGAMFVYLKLTGVIDWSWWWVLSPLWLPVAFVGIVVFGALLFVGSYAVWMYIKE